MLQTRILTGPKILPYKRALAELRIRIFRDYPYLYAGDIAYEERYLETYFNSIDSVCVLILDGDAVVGASTGIPLADETPEVRAPFEQGGWAIDTIFYCGESVLMPAYRGRGLYRSFFEARERHARSLGMDWITFCGVVRPEGHRHRPSGYQPLDAAWRTFGYEPRPELTAWFTWKDLDETVPSPKPMRYWVKPVGP